MSPASLAKLTPVQNGLAAYFFPSFVILVYCVLNLLYDILCFFNVQVQLCVDLITFSLNNVGILGNEVSIDGLSCFGWGKAQVLDYKIWPKGVRGTPVTELPCKLRLFILDVCCLNGVVYVSNTFTFSVVDFCWRPQVFWAVWDDLHSP